MDNQSKVCKPILLATNPNFGYIKKTPSGDHLLFAPVASCANRCNSNAQIKMPRMKKTTVKGFIYSVQETRTVQHGEVSKKQYKIAWCQMVKSARGGYKISKFQSARKPKEIRYNRIKRQTTWVANLPIGEFLFCIYLCYNLKFVCRLNSFSIYFCCLLDTMHNCF